MTSQEGPKSTVHDGDEEEESKTDGGNDAVAVYDEDDEDLMFRVYFRKEEIKMASVS